MAVPAKDPISRAEADALANARHPGKRFVKGRGWVPIAIANDIRANRAHPGQNFSAKLGKWVPHAEWVRLGEAGPRPAGREHTNPHATPARRPGLRQLAANPQQARAAGKGARLARIAGGHPGRIPAAAGAAVRYAETHKAPRKPAPPRRREAPRHVFRGRR